MSDKEAKPTIAQRATSVEDYRRLKSTKKVAQTFFVTVPTGAVWEMKTPDLQTYIISGRFPKSLVENFVKSAEKKGITPSELTERKSEIDLDLSMEDVEETLIFMRELVRECCVNPRIGHGEDELAPEEVDPDDFKALLQWCLSHSGVAGLAGLQSFRSRRERRASGDKSSRKKFRNQTVKSAKN